MITLWLLNDWLTTVNEAEDKECVIFLYINILIVIPHNGRIRECKESATDCVMKRFKNQNTDMVVFDAD